MAKTEIHNLHIFFFPFLAYGHIIPTVDLAKLFASKGVRATIVTTPLNLPPISRSIQTSKSLGHPIDTITIDFPSTQAGLPEGCENVDTITSQSIIPTFFESTILLQEPLEHLFQQHHPDCLIAGHFFPWVSDSAAKFGIPRIVFRGTSSFADCATHCVALYQPHKNVSTDFDPFVIPNLPGPQIKLTRMVLPDFVRNTESAYAKRILSILKAINESEAKSFGTIVNSFNDLEGVYADHYKKVLGKKGWFIGPVSLYNKDMREKANRGKQASIDEHECLKWLDSKEPDSVIYVSFGTRSNFPDSQLKEIAMALEESGVNFIWVVRRNKKEGEDGEEEWLPEGFEKRMEGKGLIIREWAPQVLILDHKAIGGIVTHCGWNTILEGVSAGKPMVTWPVSAEQFYNEKFVTEVIRIGVAVGVKKYEELEGDRVEKEAIVKAVKEIMEGEEAEEMRNRAKEYAKMAKEAVEEGGSSQSELDSLIDELVRLSN